MAKTEYQIKLNNGRYVGLVNFGRTYRACKSACRLNGLTEEKAKKLAKLWKGKLTSFTIYPCIVSNYGEGWEVETWEDNISEARESLKTYVENSPQYPHKIKWMWDEKSIMV